MRKKILSILLLTLMCTGIGVTCYAEVVSQESSTSISVELRADPPPVIAVTASSTLDYYMDNDKLSSLDKIVFKNSGEETKVYYNGVSGKFEKRDQLNPNSDVPSFSRRVTNILSRSVGTYISLEDNLGDFNRVEVADSVFKEEDSGESRYLGVIQRGSSAVPTEFTPSIYHEINVHALGLFKELNTRHSFTFKIEY